MRHLLLVKYFGEVLPYLETKKETNESDLNEHIPMIKEFIETELDKQKAVADSLEDVRNGDYTKLNELFVKVVKMM